jgi:hypothetical protein
MDMSSQEHVASPAGANSARVGIQFVEEFGKLKAVLDDGEAGSKVTLVESRVEVGKGGKWNSSCAVVHEALLASERLRVLLGLSPRTCSPRSDTCGFMSWSTEFTGQDNGAQS